LASGDAGDAVDVGEAVIVAGIGCRRGASAAEIEKAITAALELAGRPLAKLDLIATASIKRDDAGIAEAAKARGVRLTFVDQSDLELAAARGATWSERVLALAGVPSVAEAAALAAAGPKSKLLIARVTAGPVTCALASDESAP
jgi:cobalt-precorrin 5A hydrolase